jgi:uncharacterized protein (TIGR00661 family)
MARIIYGVAGQGFGHAARSHETLMHLKRRKHKILVLAYKQSADLLGQDFPVLQIPGLGLNYQNNKLSYWRTLYDNAATLIKSTNKWPSLRRKIKAFNADLVITDFEPLSATIAHIEKLPLISIDNQHQLTNSQIIVPKKYRRDFLAVKLVTKSMVWWADYYLFTSFFKTKITKAKSFLFPPIVREKIRKLKPQVKDFVLVYQNSDFDYILDELKKLKKDNFIIYSGRPGIKKDGNLILKNYHNPDWYKDLANCRAIIGTAGLSLISEALCLDKPYLAIPVGGQIEQIINALYIKKLGYGDWTEVLTSAKTLDFLKNCVNYRKNLKKRKKEDIGAIYKKLDSIIKAIV